MKKHLLFISNLYPNPALPNQATFNYQQVQALLEWFDVSVLSPIPWTDPATVRAAKINGRCPDNIDYPTYWYTPKVCRSFYGQMMLASVVGKAQKLHAAKPFDMVFGSWLYPDGWAASRLAKAWQVPNYLKVHGTDVNRLIPSKHLTRMSMRAIHNSSGVVCVSHALKSKLVELGASADKCHVIYNGVNSEIFRPRLKTESRSQLELSETSKIILYVGNLLETKGLGELAQAFEGLAKKHSDVRLLVIGSGGWKNSFIEKFRMDSVFDRVDLLGSVNHKDIGIYMNAADVLCLPSYMEGIPNVILEALASNIPVVATDVGGVPELAQYDDRISLVSPRDAEGLQAALERAIMEPLLGNQRIAIQSWRENAASVASIFMEDYK